MWRALSELVERARRRRDMRRTAVSAIGTAAEHTPIRIRGTVRALDPLYAPLTGTDCVYFAVQIDRVGATGLRTLATEHEATSFLVTDETGVAVIDTTHAAFAIPLDHSESKAAFDASPTQRALLERFELLDQPWFDVDKLVYGQAVLAPGDVVTIYGRAVREPDPDAAMVETGYREAPPMRLRLAGTARQPLLVEKVAT